MFRTLLLANIAFVCTLLFGTAGAAIAEFVPDAPPVGGGTLILFSGFLNGYVEPCGCAGLDQMKGGLGRRHSLVQSLRQSGWDVIPIDAGNLNSGASPQEEQKRHFVIEESLRLMNYQAIGLGDRDLLFPATTLLLYTTDTPGNPKRYTSANIGLYELNPAIVTPYRIVRGTDDTKIGVVSVVAESLKPTLASDDILFADPLAQLKSTLPLLRDKACDWIVLIVHGTLRETESLVASFPRETFAFVIPTATTAEPPISPTRINNKDGSDSWLIEPGMKGSHVILAHIPPSKDTKAVTFQRVALDGRFTSSPEFISAMEAYQDYLREIGLAGLGLKPTPSPLATTHGNFTGSHSCQTCHEPSWDAWKGSRHAKAFDSLTERSRPPREFDPECIACHVEGWNPQEQFPYTGGFLSRETTPRLTQVGCESCHGPGERHVAAEATGDEQLKIKRRAAMQVTLETAKRSHCATCHDHTNSPSFQFESYWDKIKHTEKEPE